MELDQLTRAYYAVVATVAMVATVTVAMLAMVATVAMVALFVVSPKYLPPKHLGQEESVKNTCQN